MCNVLAIRFLRSTEANAERVGCILVTFSFSLAVFFNRLMMLTVDSLLDINRVAIEKIVCEVCDMWVGACYQCPVVNNSILI